METLEKIANGDLNSWILDSYELKKIDGETLVEYVKQGIDSNIKRIRDGTTFLTYTTCEAAKKFKLSDYLPEIEKAHREGEKVHVLDYINKLREYCSEGSFERYDAHFVRWNFENLYSERRKWLKLAEEIDDKTLIEELNRTLNERKGLFENEAKEIEKIEEIRAITSKYDIADWFEEGNDVHVRTALPWDYSDRLGLKIAKKILESYSLALDYYSYTPEDMSEPLEAYYYFELITPREKLEEKLKEAERIKEEIETGIKKVENRLLNLLFE